MAEKNYGNNSQLAEIVKYISDNMKVPVLGAGGGFAPIGTINAYMGITAPQGWLICNGQTVNIADYPELATHFASHFGSANFFGGDGTTTFAVPDLRGEFLRGAGTNSHTNQGSGANVGVHQDGTEHTYFHADASGSIVLPNIETIPNKLDCTISQGGLKYAGTTNSGGTIPHTFTSRPTNTSVTYIIKATVSGDPNAHVYSTEEQVVGTWIDGKPIYEKTFALEQNFKAGDNVLNHNISNLGDIISISGGIKLQNGLQSPLQQAHSNTKALCSVKDFTAGTYVFGAGEIYVGELTIVRLFFTLQYTKTQ